MQQTQKYTGTCHCGKIRYQVQMELNQVISCNCSICSKSGTLLAFAPEAAFELQSGAEELSNYRFAKKNVQHLFCKHCGIRSFGRGAMPDGSPMVAINVRCLEGVEPESLEVLPFDGRSL